MAIARHFWYIRKRHEALAVTPSVKQLLDPAILAFALLVLIWLFSLTPWRAPVRRLSFLGALVLGLVYFGPLPALLSQPLAQRFPPADFNALPPPDLILVLGGMTMAEPNLEPGSTHPPFTRRSERFLMGLELAQKFPSARLVFTGWAGAEAGVRGAEATRLANLAIALGLSEDQILIDPLAQTTADHPIQLELNPAIGPDPSHTTYIVTSAIHMPRAMGVFAAQGWSDIHGVPTDYPFPLETPWFSRQQPAGKKLTIVQEALGEWAALVSYRSRDLIAQILPSP